MPEKIAEILLVKIGMLMIYGKFLHLNFAKLAKSKWMCR